MAISWKNYIKLTSRLKRASQSFSFKNVLAAFEGEGPDVQLEDFNIKKENETGPTLKKEFLKSQKIAKAARKDKPNYNLEDDEDGYFDEDVLFEAESDGEEAGVRYLSPEPEEDRVEEAEEILMSKEEKKDRFDLIKMRAEELRKKKLQSVEPEDISLRDEEPVEVEEPVVVEKAEEVEPEQEAELEDEEFEDEDDEEVGPKKRGRKSGTKGEGRSWEEQIAKLEDLRSFAYDPNSLEDYGISEKKQDQIFDLSKYNGREPELWEMAEGHIDKAKDKDVSTIKDLLKQSYEKLAELNPKTNSITKHMNEELSAVESLEKLNDMEAKFIIKYLSKKIKELNKQAVKESNKKEADQEREEDLELLKKIKV